MRIFLFCLLGWSATVLPSSSSSSSSRSDEDFNSNNNLIMVEEPKNKKIQTDPLLEELFVAHVPDELKDKSVLTSFWLKHARGVKKNAAVAALLVTADTKSNAQKICSQFKHYNDNDGNSLTLDPDYPNCFFDRFLFRDGAVGFASIPGKSAIHSAYTSPYSVALIYLLGDRIFHYNYDSSCTESKTSKWPVAAKPYHTSSLGACMGMICCPVLCVGRSVEKVPNRFDFIPLQVTEHGRYYKLPADMHEMIYANRTAKNLKSHTRHHYENMIKISQKKKDNPSFQHVKGVLGYNGAKWHKHLQDIEEWKEPGCCITQ